MPSWLKHYRRDLLAGDLGAGVIVALMLIPQGMAYAIVAGLPPVTGLYASILPALAYALFGSSMVQSVGPAAITALMIASSLSGMAAVGSELYTTLAAQMALMAGVVLCLCGLLRLGFLSNFLSRPVMSGFTTGAALLIAGGQIAPLLGVDSLSALASASWNGAAIGLGSLLALWLAKSALDPLLRRLGIGRTWSDVLSRLAPVFILVVAALLTHYLGWGRGEVRTLGAVPSGLPSIAFAASSDHWRALLSPALLVAFMIFLTSQSAAQSLALKRGERVRADSELLGLGVANIASGVSCGFAVGGSMSRSAVNYAAGANTPLAGILSALWLLLALVAPTAWLSFIPMPALAATIVVAVLGMIDLAAIKQAWGYDRSDAAALLATLGGVLLLGVEEGVVLGVVLSLATLLGRSSRPNIAVLGKIPGSEHFRDVERHTAETLPGVLLLRIDAALFFGNVDALLDRVAKLLQQRQQQGETIHHVVLVMSAVNLVDMTGLFALNELNTNLQKQGIALSLSEVKGAVLDRLVRSGLLRHKLSGQVYLSTAQAFRSLAQEN
ncbi:MAG: sulfate permease [Halioglobus sp.]|nr:sulfate permease [Halioglobus sp.]